MPDTHANDPGVRQSGIDEGRQGSIDSHHLLLVGAGPGLGQAVARRFAEGGYRVTLVARDTNGLDKLADSLADARADIDTISADAGDPEGFGVRMSTLYRALVHQGSLSTTR